jgi:hypothetical protein
MAVREVGGAFVSHAQPIHHTVPVLAFGGGGCRSLIEHEPPMVQCEGVRHNAKWVATTMKPPRSDRLCNY